MLIEQAKAMLIGRKRLDTQAAFDRLRRVAHSSSRRWGDVAVVSLGWCK
jgi:AmiR/NasT family two-component response regulator